MRYFIATLIAIVICLIYSFGYAADDDATIVYKDSQRTIRAVCVYGMQFLINDKGELTQVLTPVVDTIITYRTTDENGYTDHGHTKNYVHSAIPMNCKNIYPGAKAPY